MSEVKKCTLALVAEIDADELALRLMAIAIGLIPPTGTNASEAMDKAERDWPAEMSGPFPFRRMARAAIIYMGECVAAGSRPS